MTTTIYTVTKPDIVADPSYSPDGSLIVFVEKIGSTWKLSTLTTGATQTHAVLVSGSNPYADPMFSADGFFVLYAEQVGVVSGPEPYGQWALKYIDVSTLEVVTILNDGNANMHPTWATATQVAFQNWQYGATPSTAFQVSLIDLAGQGRKDLGEGEYPRVVMS
jgi:Tol biopolymer transport system component